MKFTPLKEFAHFQTWRTIHGERAYVIVYDKQLKEYTASTKPHGYDGPTIYIINYGEGVKTKEEAEKAVLEYHQRTLQ